MFNLMVNLCFLIIIGLIVSFIVYFIAAIFKSSFTSKNKALKWGIITSLFYVLIMNKLWNDILEQIDVNSWIIVLITLAFLILPTLIAHLYDRKHNYNKHYKNVVENINEDNVKKEGNSIQKIIPIELFKNVLKYIKGNRKVYISIISLVILILFYKLWYYSPVFIYDYQQKMNKVNSLIKQENYDKAWNFIDRAFNGNEKIKAEDMILDAQEKQLITMSKDTNPLDIINLHYSDGMLKIRVKNIGSKEINYVKYDIYYYSGTQGTGDIIGTGWSNSTNPIPPGVITDMETYIKIPENAQSYSVKIKQWN